MAYSITWTQTGVIWDYSGLLTGAEILESNDAIYGDPRFDEIRFQLVDLSRVSEFEVSELEMRQMAHLDKAAARSNPSIRLAVVAPTGPAREIAENYEKHNKNIKWESAIFETRSQAEEWLKV